MSAEILGACEHIMESAVSYALDRTQFGQPIGTFQAVQHLLAGAEVQVRALSSSLEILVPRITQLSDPATSHHLALLKALAGRTGHFVAQATLQVFGAIGFTQEHEHHRYAKRILTLDALCGSRDQLTGEIGRAARRGPLPLVAVP
jgi:alkylation response protein AidB-like acyl-CoA dehydrogenase